MSDTRQRSCDVAVIGAGMAGMAAALFAAERGLSCIQIGNGGGILYASGLLDLMGVYPAGEHRVWESPFAALATLARDAPLHPLARVAVPSIRAAFEAFIAALGSAGIAYAPLADRNRKVLTSIGTIKTTYGVPRSMLAGVDALEARQPCLLVDFRGLREFSARQIAATLGDRWPGLRHERVEFPGYEAAPELYAAHLARGLESVQTRAHTLALLKPLLGKARALGLPAVLGLARASAVHAAFEAGLGVPVFEIPTMPTSVPGLRLLGALEAAVSARGVHRRHQSRVRALSFDEDGESAVLELESMSGGTDGERVRARAVVLATGRFTGRGLTADRAGVRESILGLPVEQPPSRAAWHQRDFLAATGHAINRAGLSIDAAWRPLDARAHPVWPRLYAVGSILAHQDWMREKCGSGLAIATAWAAIEQAARELHASAGA